LSPKVDYGVTDGVMDTGWNRGIIPAFVGGDWHVVLVVNYWITNVKI